MNDHSMKAAAIVLLSGGLDSATAAAWAKDQWQPLTALTLDYGQRHQAELRAAGEVAAALGIHDHITLSIDLASFGGSALVDSSIDVPRNRSTHSMASGIPITYVPARNTIFLSLALALAETRDAKRLVLGVNAVDYSGYPDCRPEYLHAFQQLANLATKTAVEGHPCIVEAPLISMTKAEIIGTGLALGVDYGLTTSCYDPAIDGRPCGACDSCQIRAAGFATAGIADPRLARFDLPKEAAGREDR